MIPLRSGAKRSRDISSHYVAASVTSAWSAGGQQGTGEEHGRFTLT